MKSKLTILPIVFTVMFVARVEAQRYYPTADYLLISDQHVASDGQTSSSFVTDEISAAFAEAGCTDCGQSGCGKGGGCNSLAGRVFASGEYLQWYSKGRWLPILVTTSPQSTPLTDDPGVLPLAGTMFGGRNYGGDRQLGGRGTIGVWMDDSGRRAIGLRGFMVEGRSVIFSADSTGNPILARPFYNDDPLIDAQDALVVSHPDLTSFGRIDIKNDHDLYGGQLFARSLLDAGCNYRLDMIGGYRYDRIDDSLWMSSYHETGANTFSYTDLFDVQNEFHAADFGIQGEIYRDCITFSFLGKIAVGNMQQDVFINGQHVITGGGATQGPGGFLAQPTNSNLHTRDVIVWAPEANFKLNYAYSDRLNFSVGYTFMYWTRVALAGDQIDQNFDVHPDTPRLNEAQLNGGALVPPNTPSFRLRDTDFWVQTIDLGVTFNY